ncbi:hypothetical protein [Methanohalophilus sp.]
MKKSYTFFVVVFIITLISICFIALPFVFLGAPSPLFTITNTDINEHDVLIELFDSNNNLVYNNTYELIPESKILQSKPSGMLLQLSFPPGNKEEYLLKITSDDNITKSRQIELELWNTIDVKLYDDDVGCNISIGVEAV